MHSVNFNGIFLYIFFKVTLILENSTVKDVTNVLYIRHFCFILYRVPFYNQYLFPYFSPTVLFLLSPHYSLFIIFFFNLSRQTVLVHIFVNFSLFIVLFSHWNELVHFLFSGDDPMVALCCYLLFSRVVLS